VITCLTFKRISLTDLTRRYHRRRLLLHHEIREGYRGLRAETRAAHSRSVAADESEDAANPGQVPLRLQSVRSISHLGGDPQDREGRVPRHHDAVEVMGARVHASDSGSVSYSYNRYRVD